ncbi:dipeptidyl aminopeptidase/acylaminoacyl peptidase [Sphingomonas zeicaulis]|uniref:alpha/beta hydrolase family protein n=1 Tax=Sphingomonas zeicaulis TaxID=1632740 RepID=UPI003D20FB81
MDRRIAALLLLVTLTAAGEEAPAPTAVTLDDIGRLQIVAEPSFSPDGATVAYSLAVKNAKSDASSTDIWTVPFAGGAPKQLTRTDSSEWQPRYAADGATLFFLSDAGAKSAPRADPDDEKEEQEENTQLWRMPAAGGKPRRVTDLPGGISDYALAPDGRRAVVVAEVGRTVGSKAKVPPPVETERFFFKEDGRGYIDDRTRQLFIVDLATGKATQLTAAGRDHWHPAWSPDGSLIAYTAKDVGATDADLNYEIYVQPPEGGAPRKLSTSPGADGDPAWGSGPVWSADSKRLVWLEGAEDKWIYYAPHQLAVADVATGAVTRPSRTDQWYYAPQWAADGGIVALVEQDRAIWLARIDPANGATTWLNRGERTGYEFAMSSKGGIVLLDSDDRTPAELHAVGGKGALTHHNEWAAKRRLGEVREVSFKSGDAEIHGLLVLPPDHDPAKRYPLIADLHGGPVYQHGHEFDLDAQLYAAAGYAVLKVNPRGSSGRGFDYARAIYADWGNLDAKDISAGITYAIEAGIADPDRIGAGGWSYGGILTGYMIASEPRIKAAVYGAGVSNAQSTFGVDMYAREYLLELGAPWDKPETWERLAYPFRHPERISAPTQFECAEADDNVPCVGAQQMYLALKARGVPARLIVYPGENHGLTVPSYLVHRMRSNIAWYDRWLKPAAPGTAAAVSAPPPVERRIPRRRDR